MKKIHKILFSLVTAILVVGCYEDKGNYDYRDINEIIISFQDLNSIYTNIGGVLELNPDIQFVNGQGDLSKFEFKWILRLQNSPSDPKATDYTQDDWNTLNFKWEPPFTVPSSSKLRLEATDSETGVKYIRDIPCAVEGAFEGWMGGFMVLSEKDNKTMLSFVKINDGAFLSGSAFNMIVPITDYTEFVDSYTTANNGKTLPTAPIGLHEHFANDGDRMGQILVLTQNGAVDVSGHDFGKQTDLTQEFDGEVYPASMQYVADAMFMKRVDVVTDQDGHIYTRIKETDELFHSGVFLHNQLKLDGEEEPLSGCELVEGPLGVKGCLVLDNDKRRLLFIADSGNGGFYGPDELYAGKPSLLHNPQNMPENFVSLEDLNGIDILHIGCRHSEFYMNPPIFAQLYGYTMLFEKDGRYFCQEFLVMGNTANGEFAVVNPSCTEITGLPGKPTSIHSMSWTDFGSKVIAMAVGSELYLYDRANPGEPVVRFGNGFRADIVDLHTEDQNGWWLGVALADGSLQILNTCNPTFRNDHYVYYDSMRSELNTPQEALDLLREKYPVDPYPVSFGRIVDIKYKISSDSGM